MHHPNIFIVGPSGSGKSTSLRNMNPETTAIINAEREPLPFRNNNQFKLMRGCENLGEFRKLFESALDSEKVETIVIETFTAVTEFAYKQIVRDVEKIDDNVFAAWSEYKQKLHDFLLMGKNSGKYVVFLGHDDSILDHKKRITKTIDVQGSLKGRVEKEFNIVLWTKVIDVDSVPKNEPRHYFVTNSDGMNKAKTPMGMFDELYIPNDLNQVIETIKQYYGE